MTKDQLSCDNADANSVASTTESTSRKLYRNFRKKIVKLPEYTENTTVHGVKYLGDRRRPKLEKIYWILIFIVCFVVLGIFMRELIKKWREQFFVLVEDDYPTPVYKISFPAVTICPQAKIKTEDFSLIKMGELKFSEAYNGPLFDEYYKKMEIAQQICMSVRDVVSVYSNESRNLHPYHINLLHEISPTLDDIIKHVQMPDSCEMKLSRIRNTTIELSMLNQTFSTILTNEGVCFTYNLPSEILRTENLQTEYAYHDIKNHIKGWDYEQGYYSINSFPQVSCSAGEVSSLHISLTSSLPDIKTICQPTTTGYKVIVHSPAVYPTTFETYIGIDHDTRTQIKILPQIIRTSENLRSFTPQVRQCYFNGERHLKYFTFYNRINCKLECFVNYTIKYQGCVHFAFPRSEGIPICGARESFLHLYETVDNFDSMINYLNDFRDDNDEKNFGGNFDEFDFFSCDCLSECNSIEYDYKIVAEKFKFDNYLVDINKSTTSPTILEIFWDEPKFIGKTRKQFYTISDIVSNLGGLMGLFMGASVLSVFEVVYFCLVRKTRPSDEEVQQTK